MAHVSSSNSDSRRVSKQSLTIDHIDLITPWSTFAVILTSCWLSIRVKRLWRYCTGRTPAAMLNCKHAVTRSHCSCGTLFNRVFSTPIRSIQNRVLSFQGVDCTMCGVLVASNGFISLISKDRLKASWAMKTKNFLKIIWEHLKAVVTGMAKHTLNSMATEIWQPFFSKFALFL